MSARNKWPHVMVDIETMGTAQSMGAIVSVGAVGFDPGTGETADLSGPNGSYPSSIPPHPSSDREIRLPPVGALFYENVSLQSAMNLGMQVDARTIQWWMEQSEAARAALRTPNPLPILKVLSLLYRWYQGLGAKYVWSNGATFDVAILSSAYQLAGKQTPWHWRDVRDTRTVWWLLAEVDGAKRRVLAGEEAYTPHNALHDAHRQARSICEAVRIIRTAREVQASPAP